MNFELSQFSGHCSANFFLIVFDFSLDDKTIVLVVTVICHCLSLTLYNLILVQVLFCFGQLMF